jgi:hypothetical protein
MMESFWSVNWSIATSSPRTQAQALIFERLEVFYDRERLHGTLAIKPL